MDRITTLYKINRWWTTGKVDTLFLFKVVRDEFRDIQIRLEDRRILSLIGPRRVGKSTLIYQTIDFLVKSGVNPNHILLFGGDDPGLFRSKETISDILEDYLKEILSQKIEAVEPKIYIFIDEIHFIKDWQLYLKSFYDKRYNIKFIISGSSSTHLFKDSRESLMGRIEDIYILPLGLRQYTRFYNAYKEDLHLDAMNTLLPSKSLFDDVEEYYRIIDKNRLQIHEFENVMNKVVKTYLLTGGYPEFFDTGGTAGQFAERTGVLDNILLWQKRLTSDIVLRGLYRDIVGVYNIKNPEILERLMYYIAANSGGEHSYSSIARTLGVDAVTISSYMSYLSQAFFICICDNYSTNIGKIIRKNKKIFIADSGIRNAMLRNDVLSPEEEGFQVENCSVQMARNYSEAGNYGVYFWRSNQKEADIVIDKKIELLPIEVKYRNTILEKDLKGLFTFVEKYGTKLGIVITKSFLDKKDNIYYIPFWLV